MNKEIVAKRLRLLSSGVLLQEAKHLLQRYPEAELVQPSDNIHEDVELPKRTTASPLAEGSSPGFLHLQDHSNPVRYRNIWVVKK